jgi:hypothetical protein
MHFILNSWLYFFLLKHKLAIIEYYFILKKINTIQSAQRKQWSNRISRDNLTKSLTMVNNLLDQLSIYI